MNIDFSETEISNESHLSSVNGVNVESQIEMRIAKEDISELQLQKEELLFKVKIVTHPLVVDGKEDTRRKNFNSQTAESLATENIERKIDENDFRHVKSHDKSGPFNVEEKSSQSRCCEYKSCDSSTLENHIFKCGFAYEEGL
ncbi:hypothetical protein AVEN_46169-1 [Araneus ventricosus]|uniref:Uncharacterized protein n=1 Tax=Araneus ventricosus TaxID=182803 RepID=A0A4Y2D983_ARAVE|nr:hypothetical protein AVEN_46169-1 [Araneus ventricosus]